MDLMLQVPADLRNLMVFQNFMLLKVHNRNSLMANKNLLVNNKELVLKFIKLVAL